MKTKEKGITLIALAITIIVLLILAGVGINSVIQKGIIDQAYGASEESEINANKNELTLNLLEAQLEEFENLSKEDYKTILKNTVWSKIDKEKFDKTDENSEELIVTTKEGNYSYKITSTEVIYGGTLDNNNSSSVSESEPETQKVTYYFEKPDYWGSTIYAHIWVDGGTAGTTWPGLQMTNVGTQNGKSIYKIEVTEDMEFYEGHNRIIFNDGQGTGHYQTADLIINPQTNNNKIYKRKYSSNKQVLAFNRMSNWSGNKVYAYVWKDVNGTAVKNANWPGVEITANQIDVNIYAIEIDKSMNYTNIIFNDGNGGKYDHQTDDFDIPNDGGDYRWNIPNDKTKIYRISESITYQWSNYTSN